MLTSLSISDIYIFTSPSGIQLVISASPNVEITSPGRRARGFVNPCCTSYVVLKKNDTENKKTRHFRFVIDFYDKPSMYINESIPFFLS